MYAGGEGSLYVLEYSVFHPAGQIAMNLPRPQADLEAELPNCASFVGSFVDDDLSVFESAIEWLAFERVAQGCNPAGEPPVLSRSGLEPGHRWPPSSSEPSSRGSRQSRRIR